MSSTTSSPAAYDGDDATSGIPMATGLGNSSSARPDRRRYRRNSKTSSKVASVGRSEDCAAAVARETSKRMFLDAAGAGDAVVSADCSAGCAAEWSGTWHDAEGADGVCLVGAAGCSQGLGGGLEITK